MTTEQKPQDSEYQSIKVPKWAGDLATNFVYRFYTWFVGVPAFLLGMALGPVLIGIRQGRMIAELTTLLQNAERVNPDDTDHKGM